MAAGVERATRRHRASHTHLGEEEVGQLTRLLDELVVLGGIAGEEVLEDAAVGSVGHFGSSDEAEGEKLARTEQNSMHE